MATDLYQKLSGLYHSAETAIKRTSRNWAFSGLIVVSSVACGDTNNNYYVSGGDGNDNSVGVEISNCQELAERDYECNPQKYNDYMNQWGIGIEDQLRHFARTCSPEKADFFGRGPAYIKCMEQESCEDIKAGICQQYMPEH